MATAKKTTKKAIVKKSPARKPTIPKKKAPEASEFMTEEQAFKSLKDTLSQLRKTASKEQLPLINKAGKYARDIYNASCNSTGLLSRIGQLVKGR